MKTIIFSVAFVLSALMQEGCAQPSNNTSANATTQIKASSIRLEQSKDSVAVKDPLNGVLSAYLALKNALTADDGTTAQASAKTMLDKIGKVPMDKMTSDQHTLWMKYIKKLTYDATHISETDHVEHQREHFITLSKNIYDVEKGFGTNSETLYYQYCPMANDGKGAYWVSEKEKISNPFLGKKMPTCGSTKETLKVK
ncbi:MAG: DUF3347 domain-containing protein [Bacteroidia bacterium]